jgi:hypothetical protein
VFETELGYGIGAHETSEFLWLVRRCDAGGFCCKRVNLFYLQAAA